MSDSKKILMAVLAWFAGVTMLLYLIWSVPSEPTVYRIRTDSAYGTGFGVEYWGETFGLTAGHVCDTSVSGLLAFDDGSKHRILKINRALDFCTFEYSGPAYRLEPLPLEIGSAATATGYPAHIGPVTSQGSLLGIRDEGLMLSTACYMGMSGGPVFINGDVVGMIVSVDPDYTNCYAVPVQVITEALDALSLSKAAK